MRLRLGDADASARLVWVHQVTVILIPFRLVAQNAMRRFCAPHRCGIQPEQYGMKRFLNAKTASFVSDSGGRQGVK
ncbi:MAG: hypothetical protein JWQ83_2079 [Lacunisphaera sp.]|nr:hypothetical protein [Lacunisphaera sp.]